MVCKGTGQRIDCREERVEHTMPYAYDLIIILKRSSMKTKRILCEHHGLESQCGGSASRDTAGILMGIWLHISRLILCIYAGSSLGN